MTILSDISRPVTPADVKRAHYFGLTIPAVAELAPEITTANPRDSWPDWVDADRWSSEAPDEDGPAPSWDAERFEPEGIEAAWWAGFQLGQEGEYPAPPKSMAERDRYFFTCGRLAGFVESPDGRAWQDDMRACRDRVAAETPRETDGFAPGYYS